jgi:predicted permease
MVVLFIILAAGYAANKLGIITADSNKLLSKLVVNITMPCSILGSVLGGQVSATGLDAAYFMLFTLAAFLLASIIAIPLPRLLRATKGDGGLYRFMVVFGNVGFMGFPVIQSIFGSGAAFYVTLFNIPFGILCYSTGLMMLAGSGGKLKLKLLLNPMMVVSLITVLVFYTNLPVPGIIADAVELTGRMTTPSAMLIIGSTLAGIPLRDVFSDFRVYIVTFVRLIIVPVLTFFLLHLFVTDALMLGVLTALSAMPSATNTTMLCMEYGGNEQFAAKGVFLTTLFSVVTIPLLLSLLFTH